MKRKEINFMEGIKKISELQLAAISLMARMLIEDHLKEKSKSVNKLAKQSGVHPTQLYLFLKGERGLTDSSLAKIGKAMIDNP
jgi:hypothetical protein